MRPKAELSRISRMRILPKRIFGALLWSMAPSRECWAIEKNLVEGYSVMIHLYTGDGKGKTTAAVGLCIRAAGWDRQVCFAQFMKGNDTGELHVLGKLPGITILRSDKNFGFYHAMSESDKEALTAVHNRILEKILELLEGGSCHMAILDEITYPVKWGLLDRDKLNRILAFGRPGAMKEAELVLTGRDAEGFLIDAADYITEMKCVRHPYEKGIGARKGIEF